jgi:hypothetical protein
MRRLKLRHRTSRFEGGQYITATLGTQHNHEKMLYDAKSSASE